MPLLDMHIFEQVTFDHIWSHCVLKLSAFDLKIKSIHLCLQTMQLVNLVKFP